MWAAPVCAQQSEQGSGTAGHRGLPATAVPAHHYTPTPTHSPVLLSSNAWSRRVCRHHPELWLLGAQEPGNAARNRGDMVFSQGGGNALWLVMDVSTLHCEHADTTELYILRGQIK